MSNSSLVFNKVVHKDANRIIYTEGVGIGTTVTVEKLHLQGNMFIQGDLIPSSCNVYDIGSSNLRFKDLYLSGNTIDLGGTRISRSANSGQLIVSTPSGQPANISANTITVSSSNLIPNLNADLLDNQQGSFYQNATNINSGALNPLYGGTGATVVTGSGSNVLSASPTFTGTVQAANLTASGTVAANAITVTSTGLVTNLNADLLDGQQGSYYTNVNNMDAGTLPVARGGTGQSSLTVNKVLVGNNTSGILQPANLHWDSGTNRLGINNQFPSNALDVVGNAYVSGTIMASNLSIIGDFVTMNTVTSNTEQMVINNIGTGPALRVTQTGNTPLAEFFDSESGSAMFIDNNGLIGFSTNVPLAKLYVLETGSVDAFRVDDQVSDTTPFIIKADGLVGIGTTAPQTALQVEGQVRSSQGYAVAGNAVIDSNRNLVNIGTISTAGALTVSTNTVPGILVTPSGGGNANGTPMIVLAAGGGSYAGMQYYADGSIRLGFLATASDLSNTLCISKATNAVGVGTTSPQELLQVEGNIALSGANRFVGTRTNHNLSIRTNNTDRITIDNNGNVGIGTNISNKRLTIAGSAEIGISDSDYQHLRLGGGNSSGFLYGAFAKHGDGIYLSYNYYNNNSTNIIPNSGGGTSRIGLEFGKISFYTGDINTEPNILGFYQNSLGNVGIKTIFPEESLQIDGFVRSSSGYKVGSITVIDSSRNITNIGSISSTSLTLSGSRVFTQQYIIQTNDTVRIAIPYTKSAAWATITIYVNGIGTADNGTLGARYSFTYNATISVYGAGLEVAEIISFQRKNSVTINTYINGTNETTGILYIEINTGDGFQQSARHTTDVYLIGSPQFTSFSSGTVTSVVNTISDNAYVGNFNIGALNCTTINTQNNNITMGTGNLTVGNVGIGTTIARSVVDLHMGITNARHILISGNTGLVIPPSLFGTALGYNQLGGGGGFDIIDLWDNGSRVNILNVSKLESNILTNVFTIKSSGNVGIGTGSPLELLHVEGNIALSGAARFVGTRTNHNLSIRTNNTDRITIDNNGNIGIGITTPITNLVVGFAGTTGEATYNGYLQLAGGGGSTTSGGGLEFKSSNAGSGWGWRLTAPDFGSGDVPFIVQSRHNSTSWTERIRINASGFVGIGGVSAIRPLHIKADTGSTLTTSNSASNTNYGQLVIESNSAVTGHTGTGFLKIGYDHTAPTFGKAFIQAVVPNIYPTDLLLQPSDGQVGIGTTVAQSKLHVQGSSIIYGDETIRDGTLRLLKTSTVSGTNNNISILINKDTTFNNTPGFHGMIAWIGHNRDVSNNLSAYISAYKDGGSFDDAGHLVFGTSDGANYPTERMRITVSGNVGIGTTNPQSKLDVRGIALIGDVGGGAYNSLATVHARRSNKPHIVLEAIGSQTGGIALNDLSGLVYGFDGNGSHVFRTGVSGGGDFSTTGTERMRITSSGNVGIGTNSPQALLHVNTFDHIEREFPPLPFNNSTTTMSGLASTTTLTVTNNLYGNGIYSVTDICVENANGSGLGSWRAFDQDTTTSFRTCAHFTGANFTSSEISLTIQFPTPVKLTRYTIYQPANTNHNPKAWNLRASIDGDTYIVINSQTNVEWTISEYKNFIVSTTTAYRFYRFGFTQTFGATALYLVDVRFYGYIQLDLKDAQNSQVQYVSSLIASNGRVGIGTTNPQAALHVNSTGNSAIIGGHGASAVIIDDIAGAKYRMSTGGYHLSFQQHTGGTNTDYSSWATRMILANNGNVGIGTTAPVATLHVAGNCIIDGVSATGGTVTEVGGYRIHTFTSSGTFTVTNGGTVEYLVVAGGGGGGNGNSNGYESGGGGAGGLIYNTAYTISSGSYNITIGAGGAGSTDGGNSVFHALTTIGGGRGGSASAGGNGGSGGGGSHNQTTGGLGTPGQGNNGGTAITSSRAAGGGGAGQAGSNSGPGGNGLQISISGTATYYAGGGGGVVLGTSTIGGLGGGGTAPGGSFANGGNATGYGSGGGGANGSTSAVLGGTGSSGIVIIRYLISTPSSLQVGGNITSSGTVSSATGFMFRNRIINGDMRIDQRNAGASVTAPSTFVVATYIDRWMLISDGSNYIIQQSTDAPIGFTRSLSITKTSTTGIIWLRQNIEGINISDFELGTSNAVPFTLSFWVKSSSIGTLAVSVNNNNRTQYIAPFTIFLANVWEKKTIVVQGPTIGTWNRDTNTGLVINISLGSLAFQTNIVNTWYTETTHTMQHWVGSTILPANTVFQLTGVQLEKGNIETPFEYRPLSVELQLCQRYTYALLGSVNTRTIVGPAFVRLSTLFITSVTFPTRMRRVPTFTSSSGAAHFNTSVGNGDVNSSTLEVEGGSIQSVYNFALSTTVTGPLTIAQAGLTHLNSTSAFVIFDAEL